MTQQAAIALDIELVVLCADLAQGAGPVIPGSRQGDPGDRQDVEDLARVSDIVTLDHELVDLDLLRELIDGGTPVRPGPDSLEAAVDKGVLRRRLSALGVGFPDHLIIAPGDRAPALPDWSHGVVVKAARGGYDGRGVWFPESEAEAQGLVAQITASGWSAIVEERLPDLFEVAVMAARRPGGETVVYDPVRTFQEDGICVGLEAPAGISQLLEEQVRELARTVVEELDVVGVCAVEMFIHDGKALVSEIAARPHNSGHHTIEASFTSQFENHLRAVCDLPLGDPSLSVPGVGLANILGGQSGSDPADRLREALEIDPSAKVHLYGKEPRPGRKLGHVTVIDADTTSARARAGRVADHLAGVPANVGARS